MNFLRDLARTSTPDGVRTGRVFRFAITLLLGEIGWMRSLRIRLTRMGASRTYRQWIAAHEPDPVEIARQKVMARDRASGPTFLVIQGFVHPSAKAVERSMETMTAQTYPGWHMCLVLGRYQGPGFAEAMEGLLGRDARVQALFDEEGASHPQRLASILRRQPADFVVFLNERELLAPDALWEVTRLLNDRPEAGWVYSDEDRLDADNTRHAPWFKPDWSPEMLLSTNYLHPAVIRRDLVLAHAIQREPEVDPIEQWESLLELLDEAGVTVVHIPKVLCHVRDERPSKLALDETRLSPPLKHVNWVIAHLQQRGARNVRAGYDGAGILHVKWDPSQLLVSIIIPTRDNLHALRRCLRSLLALTAHPRFEVLLVDSGGTSRAAGEYIDGLAQDPRIRVLRYPGEFNYSAANNLGARHASGTLLMFLNDDIEVIDREWLDELTRWAELPDIGIVGAKLLYPNRSIQHAGIVLGLGGHAGHVFLGANEGDCGAFGSTEWYRDFLAVTGACMMMRREVFEEVKGFDEGFQLAFGDVDICLRVVKRGYRILYNPFARVVHYEGSSRGRFIPPKDMSAAYDGFSDIIRVGDPYFNPNLSYSNTYPMVAPLPTDRAKQLEAIMARARLRAD